MKRLVVLLLMCNACYGTLVYDEMELKESITIKGDMTGIVEDLQKIIFNDNTFISTITGTMYMFQPTGPTGPAHFVLEMDTDGNGTLEDVFKIVGEDYFFRDASETGNFGRINFKNCTTNDRLVTFDMGDRSGTISFADLPPGEVLFIEGESNLNQDLTTDSGTVVFAGLTLTGDIDLSDNAITDVNYIDFVTGISAPAHSEGRIFYDDDEKTLSVYNNESDVSLQLGQEMFIRATNKTGVTILNGALVYIDGAQGSRPTIALAKADNVATCQVLAMATHDIDDNATGFVTTNGLVHDVNTDSITAGNAIFLSAATAGAYTDTSPTAPDFVIQVGRCIFENSTSGLIYIDIGPTAVCGTMVIQDLDINTNLDVAGTVIGGDATFDSLTLDLGNDYLLTERGSGQSLAIQNIVPTITSRLELFTNDGDGTDGLEFNIYAKGLPADITNREVFGMEYVTVPAGGPLFEMHTSASGTGTILPYRIYTGANTAQLVLATNGNVSMAGDLTVNDLIIGDNRFIGSASDTDAIQIEADGDVVLTQNLYIPSFLIHSGDPDTFIDFSTADEISIHAGGAEFITCSESVFQDLLTFNDGGVDIDLRVKAVGQGQALFVQGSDGSVGIRTASPDTTFQVVGTAGFGDDAGNEMLVSATGDTSWVGTAGLPYGDIHGFDENDTIAIGGIGIANKAQITTFDTDTAENNTDADHANDHIQITIAGFYYCTVSIHMESAGGGAADEFGFGVYKNNGTTLFENLHGHRKLAGGGGDVGAVTLSGIIDLAVNDTIEVWCWNEDSADDVVIDDITLSLMQIGGT